MGGPVMYSKLSVNIKKCCRIDLGVLQWFVQTRVCILCKFIYLEVNISALNIGGPITTRNYDIEIEERNMGGQI